MIRYYDWDVCLKTNPNLIGTLCMGDEKVARLGRVYENQSELHWDTVYGR